MDKRRLPLLVASVCLLLAAGDARALTLAEAAEQSRMLAQSGDGLLPPLYGPEPERREDPEGINSPWQALGLSLLLPGAGQMYGGAPRRARIFLGAEVVVWGLALGFDRWSAWRDQDAVDYAVAHAGLTPEGKDDQFLEYLEFYASRDEFNRAGRIIDPSRPFIPETADTYWQWDSYDSRRVYRDLRNEAESASRNATFMLYMAALNRVVSAVDAFRVVRKNNGRIRDEQGLKLGFKPKVSLSNPGFRIHAAYRF